MITRLWSELRTVLRGVGALHAWNVDFCTCCEGDGRLRRCRAY